MEVGSSQDSAQLTSSVVCGPEMGLVHDRLITGLQQLSPIWKNEPLEVIDRMGTFVKVESTWS